QWATFISTPQVAADQSTVRVESAVINQSNAPQTVALQITLLGPDGKTVQTAEAAPQRIEAGKAGNLRQDISVKNPRLWNLDQPNLYHAIVRVRAGNTTLDHEVIDFGILEA